jgi:hemerythrin-like domain-containing protein
MTTIHSYLTSDHRLCDNTLADLESAISKNNWSDGAAYFSQFCKELLRHFNCEETILFPAFEEASGMSGGPTMVMRMEHAQMREMLNQLAEAVADKNLDRVLGISETLMIYIQQHNGKEEQMLYNMCDMHLSAQRDGLIAMMRNIKE